MTNISEYTFNSINVGDSKEFDVVIDESLVNNFASMSGDHNPLHMNEEYAKTTNFSKRVCHGMLIASFLSRLVGMHMPGKNSLYFSQTLNFRTPCFLNDKITVKGEVIEKHQTTKIITMKTTITNQFGKTVIDGVAKVIVRS